MSVFTEIAEQNNKTKTSGIFQDIAEQDAARAAMQPTQKNPRILSLSVDPALQRKQIYQQTTAPVRKNVPSPKEWKAVLGAWWKDDLDNFTNASPEYKQRWAKEVYARAQYARDYIVSLGGRLGPKGMKKELAERAEEFTGLGSVTMPATSESVKSALEWRYLYPILFKGNTKLLNLLKKVPGFKQAGKFLDKIGGLEKIKESHSQMYLALKDAIQSITTGGMVGTEIGGVESVAQGLEPKEALVHTMKTGGSFAAISGLFSAASSYDKMIYLDQLEKAMTQRLDADLQDMMNRINQSDMPIQDKTRAIKRLSEVVKPNGQRYISEIKDAEMARLYDLTGQGDLYKNIGGKRVQKPTEAADRFMKEGMRSVGYTNFEKAQEEFRNKAFRSWFDTTRQAAMEDIASGKPKRVERGNQVLDYFERNYLKGKPGTSVGQQETISRQIEKGKEVKPIEKPQSVEQLGGKPGEKAPTPVSEKLPTPPPKTTPAPPPVVKPKTGEKSEEVKKWEERVRFAEYMLRQDPKNQDLIQARNEATKGLENAISSAAKVEAEGTEAPASAEKTVTIGEPISQRTEKLRDFPPENVSASQANRLVVSDIIDEKLYIGNPGDIHSALESRILGNVIEDPSLYEKHETIPGFYDPETNKFHPSSEKQLKRATEILLSTEPSPSSSPSTTQPMPEPGSETPAGRTSGGVQGTEATERRTETVGGKEGEKEGISFKPGQKTAKNVFKHWTSEEGQKVLESGNEFDFGVKPIHGTGSLGKEDKVNRFAGNRIYLSLDDKAWGSTVEFIPSGEPDLELTGPNAKDNFERKQKGELQGKTYFDYDKQVWVLQQGTINKKKLYPVEYKIKDNAKTLVIDSIDAYLKAQKEAGDYLLDGEKAWDNLSKKYDIVVLKNVRKIIDETDNKFFRAAMADQIIVLNQDAVSVVPTNPKSEKKETKKQFYGTPSDPDIQALSNFISNKMVEGQKVNNKTLRQWAAEAFGVPVKELIPAKGYSHKSIQESAELALVKAARKIVQKGTLDKDTFDELVKLYENQPVLTQRTGKSVQNQAYSTPAPLAFLADMAAGVKGAEEVLEPTAGNGMLLIGVPFGKENRVTANEIDPIRAKNLENQGYPTQQEDAGIAYIGKKQYNAIVMNPPFGSAKKEDFDGYGLTKIEHIIAAMQLLGMAQDGRAVIIVGAEKVPGKYGKPNWVFGNYLYSHYNVIGDFEVSGDLYSRQGAGWPVRVFVIHGIHKSQNLGPESTKKRANSWDKVYTIMKEVLDNEPKRLQFDEGVGSSSKRQQQGSESLGGVSRSGTGGSEESAGVQKPGGKTSVSTGTGKSGKREGAESKTDRGRVPGGTSKSAGTGGPSSEQQPVDQQQPGSKGTVPQEEKAKKTAAGEQPKPTGTGRGAGKHEPPGVVGGSQPVKKKITENLSAEKQKRLDEIKKKLKGKLGGQQLNVGIDPETLFLLAEAGTLYAEALIKEGIRSFKDWATTLIDNLGPSVIPHLKSTYNYIRSNPQAQEFASEMESQESIDKISEDAVRSWTEQSQQANKLQIKYEPKSKSESGLDNIPTYLAPFVAQALDELEAAVGDVDEYVRKELKYDTQEEMFKCLSGSQIDSIALTLHNLSKGGAMIVGHQTGVGKGRVAAGVIRKEIKAGKRPVFFTAGKNLFSDIYRDLINVGMKPEEMNFLIVNADGEVRNVATNELIVPSHRNRAATNKEIRKTREGKRDYNCILSTYSQINKEGNTQQQLLPGIVADEVLILDESHLAAGDSNTGAFFRDQLIASASGVLYMSATYAKRPDNMPVYYRTGMLDAFDGDMRSLIDSVQAGGDPFQEVLAATLAKAHSYTRTELSFDNVDYQTVILDDEYERDAKRADEITGALQEIIYFDETVVEGLVEQEMKKRGISRTKQRKQASSSITHTNFSAVVHNAVKQMLLAIKVLYAIQEAKQAIKEGRKPLIVLENTMGSFMDRYLAQEELSVGDIIRDFDYRAVLRNLLDGTLRYREVTPGGEEIVHRIDASDHPEYKRLVELINSLDDLGLPGSPIDEIINELGLDDLKGGEITGRKYRLERNEDGDYVLRSRTGQDKDKTFIVYQFNDGQSDFLILNVAGAEGISMHASEEFSDKRPRRMIVLQPPADINKFIQLLGRINRRAQIENPEYRVLMTGLPAEKRPAAVLEKKMRSLNANASAKSKGAFHQEDVPDIMNLYGDWVVAAYLVENPDIGPLVRIGSDQIDDFAKTIHQSYHGTWHEMNLAQKVTGRIALLSVAQQEQFYEVVEQQYNDLIDMLTKTGENELISEDKDYRAELIDRKEIFSGDPLNIWQKPAFLDQMSILVPGRPMTTDEIEEEVHKVVGAEEGAIGEQKKRYRGDTGQAYEVRFPSKNVDVLEKAKEYSDKIQEKIRKATERYLADNPNLSDAKKKHVEDTLTNTLQGLYRIFPSRVLMNPTMGPNVILEIMGDWDKKFKQNPAAASRIRIKVAIPEPNKTIVVPLSKIMTWQNWYGSHENLKEVFNVPADSRQERYFINGNIIAGMGQIAGTRGLRPKIVNYTLEDGTQTQGILLPKNFDPDEQISRRVSMLPEAAAEYISGYPSNQHSITAGDSTIRRGGSNAVMIIPASKARGLIFFGDKNITDITGDFETHGTREMVAYFRLDSQKLTALFKVLQAKGYGLYSDENDSDTARELNRAYREGPGSQGGSTNYGEPSGESTTLGSPAKRKRAKKPRPKIPVQKRTSEEKTKERVSARQISKYLSKAFGVPIRGKATSRHKKIRGYYDVRTRGIRVFRFNNIDTAAHEIGHHIDLFINNYGTKRLPKGIGAELVRLGKNLYGRRKPAGNYTQEGYADFIRYWLNGLMDLEKEAPKMLQFFEEEYLPNNPIIESILEQAREAFEVWESQGAEARFKSQIINKEKKPSLRERLHKFNLWFRTMFTNEVSWLTDQIEEWVGERNIEKPTKDPGYLFEYFTQKDGARARQMVLFGTIDLWGNRTGKGLKEILSPLVKKGGRKEVEQFLEYMVAARAMILEMRGITSGFSNDDAMFVFQKYNSPLYKKIALEVTEWNHRIMDYLVQAGGLEWKAAQRMKELNPIYVPFLRYFEPGEKQFKSGVGIGLVTNAKGVHAIHGSGREIWDVMESMIKNTKRIIQIAHKTMIARALANMEGVNEGIAGLIWKVPPPLQKINFKAEQVKRQLMQMGVEFPEAGLREMEAMLSVYINSPIYMGKDNIISLLIEGKRQWYEVSPELLRVLKGLDQFILPKALYWTLGLFARSTRLGATGIHAAFGLVRNPIRDSLDTIFKGTHARGPFSSAKGILKDVSRTGLAKALGIKPSKAAEDFVAMGGQISGFLGQDRKSLQHLKGESLASTVSGYTLHTIRHPIDALRELFGVAESGPRIQEYHKAIQWWMKKHGYKDGSDPPPDAKVYAFLKAQDQTINYSRHGVLGKWINQMVPFWNANVQDPSKIYRTFKERGKSATAYAITFLTIPALYIWYHNKDKDWYKKLPAYERVNYIHIEVGEDRILRLPVPFLVGHLFMSMPVGVMDSLYRTDPDKIKEVFSEAFRQDVLPITGRFFFDQVAFISPLIDVLENKNWAGMKIIPERMRNYPPAEKYLEYTTEFAKAMGRVFNVSPIQIEYVLNSWSGGLYRRVSEIPKALEGKTQSPADRPIIGTLFVRDPFAPKQQLDDFYTELERLEQANASKETQISREDAVKRRRYLKIRPYISHYLKKLHETKTEQERKEVYKKIEQLLNKAEEKNQ